MGTIEVLSLLLLSAGAGFFLAGTVGLLRFPDVYTRLHALTKADNTGLGLIIAGLMLQNPPRVILMLLIIWLLVLLASASGCHLIARAALRRGITPWKKP